jgi:hypothetical protein
MPEARLGHSACIDSQDAIYVFGGFIAGPDSSDLWRIATGTRPDRLMWTLLAGTTDSNVCLIPPLSTFPPLYSERCSLQRAAGVYGIRGVPNSANFPAARNYASIVVDANDDLLLAGEIAPSVCFGCTEFGFPQAGLPPPPLTTTVTSGDLSLQQVPGFGCALSAWRCFG